MELLVVVQRRSSVRLCSRAQRSSISGALRSLTIQHQLGKVCLPQQSGIQIAAALGSCRPLVRPAFDLVKRAALLLSCRCSVF